MLSEMITFLRGSTTTLLIAASLSGCCFSTANISLGDGYKVSEFSQREVSIMYCHDNCCNSGVTVVPQTIIAFDHDDTWIIAKSDSTYHNDENGISYWIFKKVKSNRDNLHATIKANLVGPLDSSDFHTQLSKKDINLKLVNY